MVRPKKNHTDQRERKRALSGDSMLVNTTVGEGNISLQYLYMVRIKALWFSFTNKSFFVDKGSGKELFSLDSNETAKPFILASTGERNNNLSSGSDCSVLAKSKEGINLISC